jgi:hypothetical protein
MRPPRSESGTTRCGGLSAPVPRSHWIVRDPRVARVRTAIAAGCFRVNAEAVADSLLAGLFVTLARKRGHH